MKNNITFFKLTLVTLAVALVLAACGDPNTGKKVLNIAREMSPNTVNYLSNESAENSLIIGNFSEGLVTYDQNGDVVPGLAESWEQKGNVYTFKLRNNLKWSNEAPITAQDFVFGWQTLMTHPVAPYKFIMADIKNGQAVAEGKQPVTDLGIKAIDERTVEVTLERERAYALTMLTYDSFLPLNESFYNQIGADNYGSSAETVIASGPFTLTAYNPDTGYTLSKNPNYWNAPAIDLDEVNVKRIAEPSTQESLYQSGELDVLLVDSNLYDKYANDAQLQSFATGTTYHFYLSGSTATPSPALSNADFRQAVNYAVDKTLLTNNVLKNGSLPLDYLIPINFGNIHGKSYRDFAGGGSNLRFDVKKAQEYFNKAKQVLSDEQLEFTIAYGEAPINKLTFESVKSQLETNLPGIKINLTPVPGSTYFSGLARGDTPAAFSGWSPDYNDVATYFNTFVTGNSMNYGKYSNEAYDALYEQAQNETDSIKRANLFKEAEALLVEDGAMVPLFQRGRRYLVSDKLESFHYNTAGPDINFRFISLK